MTPCSVPRGGFLYTMIVPGKSFAPFKSCPGGGGVMVLDGIDTCIRREKRKEEETLHTSKRLLSLSSNQIYIRVRGLNSDWLIFKTTNFFQQQCPPHPRTSDNMKSSFSVLCV